MQELIDKASKICGSDAALARQLCVSRAMVVKLRKGSTITPDIACILADITGEDIKTAIFDAMIRQNSGTQRGERLRAVLGKWILGASEVLQDGNNAREKTTQTRVNGLQIV